jgi:hypothetical protein
MRKRFIAFGLILIAAGSLTAGVTLAGPPLNVDDPETPGMHGWEVNVSDDTVRTRSLLAVDAPHVDINYGTLEHDQWKIEFPLVQFTIPEKDSNSHPHAGLGDALVGYKYRFLDESNAGISASVYPQFLLPTGNRNIQLGQGQTEFLTEFQLGKHFLKEKLFIYAEVGHTMCFNDSQFDSWDYGIAADWKETKKLELMCDVGGHAFPDDPVLDYAFFEGGFAYHFNDNVALIGSAGSSFRVRTVDTPEFTSFLGFQFTWGVQKTEEAEKKEEPGDKPAGKPSSS